jgi:hypothetical protein
VHHIIGHQICIKSSARFLHKIVCAFCTPTTYFILWKVHACTWEEQTRTPHTNCRTALQPTWHWKHHDAGAPTNPLTFVTCNNFGLWTMLEMIHVVNTLWKMIVQLLLRVQSYLECCDITCFKEYHCNWHSLLPTGLNQQQYAFNRPDMPGTSLSFQAEVIIAFPIWAELCRVKESIF